jgi:hypothetical protein
MIRKREQSLNLKKKNSVLAGGNRGPRAKTTGGGGEGPEARIHPDQNPNRRGPNREGQEAPRAKTSNRVHQQPGKDPL